ncbi:MAG: murein biosynthesis integral membrane protein MurJ [Chloroflexi bacterium]|nr:murein biosynthesis integral membrane protein MurJ [Chloroflexota bacterium]
MGIAKAALIIMAGNIVSRLLGIVREQIIAALFGASAATDAFTAASRVPTTVYDFLVGGMLSAALIPVLADYVHHRDEAELWRTVSLVLNLILLALAFLLALLAWLAEPLMGFLAFGFSPQVRSLSVGLVQLMLPSVLFMGVAGVFTSLLYARRSFLLPAFSAAAYNAGIVIMALLFHNALGIHSLVLGVMVGAFFQVAIQWPGVRGMRYTFSLSLSHPGVRRIMGLYLPVALGLLVSAAGIAIDSNLASRTGEGGMAAMRFATTLVQFPLGLVATAMGYALLPTLSYHAGPVVGRSGVPEPTLAFSQDEVDVGRARQKEASEAYRATLALGMKLVLLTTVPAAAGLVMLRVPIIRLLFQHGVFNPQDTQRTALAFLGYAPGMVAAAVDQILVFAFYARKNTVTPVIVGVVGVAAYVVVGLALVQPLGVLGLTIANSVQWTLHALVLLFLMGRVMGGFRGTGLSGTFVRSLGAGGAMMVALAAMEFFLTGWVSSQGGAAQVAYLALAVLLGAGAYVGAMAAVGQKELKVLRQALRTRGTVPVTEAPGTSDVNLR